MTSLPVDLVGIIPNHTVSLEKLYNVWYTGPLVDHEAASHEPGKLAR